MDTATWVTVLVGTGGAASVIIAFAKSSGLRSAAGHLFGLRPSHELVSSVEHLKTVVEAQGQSIDWLRTELDATRQELAQARSQLAATEALRQENDSLRARVNQLEDEVRALEAELRRRRKYTPKKLRLSAEEPDSE